MNKTAITFLLALFYLVLINPVFADDQKYDILAYNGSEFELLENPLDIYFEQNTESKSAFIKNYENQGIVRDYYGEFIVKKNKLIIKDVYRPYAKGKKALKNQ